MANNEAARTQKREHSMSLTNREKLKLSGVEDVRGFDEETVILTTAMGELTVHGSGLHVERIDLEAGELSVSGRICELAYSDASVNTAFWHRLFG